MVRCINKGLRMGAVPPNFAFPRRRLVLSRGSIRGFTVIELLVMLALLSVLIALLAPALGAAREKARRAVCASNLREIAIALDLYTIDWENWFPSYHNGSSKFGDYIDPFFDTPQGPHCLSREFQNEVSSLWFFTYGYNFGYLGNHYDHKKIFRRMTDIRRPSQIISYADTGESSKDPGHWYYLVYWITTEYGPDGEYPIGNRHKGGANAVSIDGHVEWQLKPSWDDPANIRRWKD